MAEASGGTAGAATFVVVAEGRLAELRRRVERAAWVYATYITDDTARIAAEARRDLIAATVELAAAATSFVGATEPAEVARKLRLLRLSLALPAPADAAAQRELTALDAWLEGEYGKARYCPPGRDPLDLEALSRILAESRDPAELLEAWTGWHAVGRPMRQRYERLVALANEGARAMGFADLGVLWRSGYDMAPDAFAAELDRLWEQVRPLYRSLHRYVRRRLGAFYGTDLVPPGGPIPAHLLGNMWAQDWTNIRSLVAPPGDDPADDLSELLRAGGYDPLAMVRSGEAFFTSLGFDPLPATFWERSMFTKPTDRDVVCHASAWDVDDDLDLRIKMCIDITGEDFTTIHHELGHNVYQRAYRHQPPLFRDGANDGFHEAIGDAIALSMTPEYLVRIGLLERAPGPEGDIPFLLGRALEKVAGLPWAYLVDRWRWAVFSGEVGPGDYNAAWWELKLRHQGVAPPLARTEEDFDPGAKYHIPASVPYARYFLAAILQFQFHRALCRAAGADGPLHRASIFGSREAGRRLGRMLEMGRSRPWPDALEALTGEREFDAGALLEYFAPLQAWLDGQAEAPADGAGA